MKNTLVTLLSNLNLIEVKGQTNLALLYNAMDLVKKLIDNAYKEENRVAGGSAIK